MNEMADVIAVEDAVALLEFELGIHPGFLRRLAEEDDWSFVIKGHALIEAALSCLLADALSEPALQRAFANMETSHTKSGKLAFLKHLALLNVDARRFIRSLSELRNELVHDVSQIGFNFADYVKSLDAQQRRNFANSFGYFASAAATGSDDGLSVDTFDFMIEQPKIGIWYSVLDLCAAIYLSKDPARLRRLLASLQPQSMVRR